MTQADMQALVKRHEGKRNGLYADTRGNASIGYGHNLSAKPLSDRAIQVIFEDDYADTVAGLTRELAWFGLLDGARQAVLIDMAFNEGVTGLISKWPVFLQYVQRGEYAQAAATIRTSRFATQAPRRAAEDADLMEQGAVDATV
jgi:lysozyme